MHLVVAPPTTGGLVRQRIVKSGTQEFRGSLIQVTGWASDPAEPAVITGDALVVAGAGAATVTAQATFASTGSKSTSSIIQLRRNNTTVAETTISSGASGTWTVTWVDADLADGDQITLWSNQGLTFTVSRIQPDSSWIDIMPV